MITPQTYIQVYIHIKPLPVLLRIWGSLRLALNQIQQYGHETIVHI